MREIFTPVSTWSMSCIALAEKENSGREHSHNKAFLFVGSEHLTRYWVQYRYASLNDGDTS